MYGINRTMQTEETSKLKVHLLASEPLKQFKPTDYKTGLVKKEVAVTVVN